MNNMIASSCRTDRWELNCDTKQWNHLCSVQSALKKILFEAREALENEEEFSEYEDHILFVESDSEFEKEVLIDHQPAPKQPMSR